MKSSLGKKICLTFVALMLSVASVMIAQPAASPLDVQGLDQNVITGARSRAMGGTGIASANDGSALFSNPAALSRLTSFEIRASGVFGKILREQSQQWVPMRPVPGLSVLFEGLTGTVVTPLDSLGRPLRFDSTVQRQYDNMSPNWNNSSSKGEPFSLTAALPLMIGGINIGAGIGISQVMNLDSYYQNNNSMSPYLGQLRPYPKFFTNRNDTVDVQWYQYIRKREGSLYGITPGASITLLPGFTLGGSATVISGSSDDNENRVERGHLNVKISNGVGENFWLDTVYYQQSKVGTSKYSGTRLNFGFLLQQKYYSIGLTIKPRYTLTRTWDRDVTSLDTTQKPFPVRIDSLTTRSYHESGTEDLNFPLAYSLGIVLTPTDRWTVALDYEVRNLADMEVTTSDTSQHPWVNKSAAIRLGAEYRASDILSLRGGYREDIQAFSPDGSAIVDEPARGGIYSFGAGIVLGHILIDCTYEYSVLKYQDIYQSNENSTTRKQHQVMIDVAYRF